MKLDFLFFGAHPDDVELSCAGTILKLKKQNKKIGIVDLTEGELGSRGTKQTRCQEATNASQLMGVMVRENLKMKDGFINSSKHEKENILKVVSMIRKYQPKIIFANAIEDRHPDHGAAAEIVSNAIFLSGLIKIKTPGLLKWKPDNLFFYIQDKQLDPDFIIDISDYFKKKLEVVKCYTSQFYNISTQTKNNVFNASEEPNTYISTELFWDNLKSKAAMMGHKIGVQYGEAYMCKQKLGFTDFEHFLPNIF